MWSVPMQPDIVLLVRSACSIHGHLMSGFDLSGSYGEMEIQ